MPIATNVLVTKWKCSECDEIYDTIEEASRCEQEESEARKFFIKEIYLKDIGICEHNRSYFKFRMIIELNDENLNLKYALNLIHIDYNGLKIDYNPHDKIIRNIAETIYIKHSNTFSQIEAYIEQVIYTIFIKISTNNLDIHKTRLINLDQLIDIKNTLFNKDIENIYSSEKCLFRKYPILVKNKEEVE